ncbi:hypothetical protein O181_029597 [Austropuccinia psidii MF-1]|uniref:Uncharacterized protein n=1 Tax=Austropuccinia psidii MF-1 TaxID=1389203 RepID=A0A9Q3H3N3_9BASI|nr:hypothetical protein [Austropuccinia psidii MF-1]
MKKLHSQVIKSILQYLNPSFSSITSSSSTPSPITLTSSKQSRPSPMPPSRKLKPVAITSSHYRFGQFPMPYPASQVFQQREDLTIRVTREDPNVVNEG